MHSLKPHGGNSWFMLFSFFHIVAYTWKTPSGIYIEAPNPLLNPHNIYLLVGLTNTSLNCLNIVIHEANLTSLLVFKRLMKGGGCLALGLPLVRWLDCITNTHLGIKPINILISYLLITSITINCEV